MKNGSIVGVVYSKFDEKIGPHSPVWKPASLSNELKENVSLKSITVLAGEKGIIPKSLAIIPFPSVGMKGLVKLFAFKDEEVRGRKTQCAITVLFKEFDDVIFYKYINNFVDDFEDTATKIVKLEESDAENEEIKKEIGYFYEKVQEILKDLRDNEISKKDMVPFPIADASKKDLQVYRGKVIVCGDQEVGKTSIILRFTDKAFRKTYIPTIGVNITEKVVNLVDNAVELLLWDIAGQIKFQHIRKHFYEGANALILVFDLTRSDSFFNLRQWNKDICSNLESHISGIILCNKCDLKDQIIVTEEEINELARELNYDYLITSALTGDNINLAFDKIAKDLIKNDI